MKTKEEIAAYQKEWYQKNREKIAAQRETPEAKERKAADDRARYLAENPDAKEICNGTPAERFEFYYDPFQTIPVDLERAVPGYVYFEPCRVGWKGSTNKGYPRMKDDNGKTVLVHRWRWTELHGPTPEGMELRHLCNNGNLGCLTISHMQLGTHSENEADKIAAGTAGRKLTVEAVREIRGNPDKLTQRELGLRYGVAWSAISDIINRKRYREVA